VSHAIVFESLYQTLINTIPIFLLSSLTLVVVGASLATSASTSGKYWVWIANLHGLPLFLAPVVFSKVVVTLAVGLWGSQVKGNALLLGLLGFCFHSWLAYFLLSFVFSWKERLHNARALCINLPPGRLKVRFLIYLLETIQPLCFTFVACLIFQQAMVSAPFFLDKSLSPVVYFVITQRKSVLTRIGLGLLVVILIIVLLALAYLASSLFVNLAARSIRHGSSVRHRRLVSSHFPRAFSHFASFALPGICMLSVSMVTLLSAFVLLDLARKGAGGDLFDQHARDIVASLFSSGQIAGIVGSMGTVGLILLTLRRGPHRVSIEWVYDNRAIQRVFQVAALVPPAVMAFLGLYVVVGPLSGQVIGYLLLIGYSVVLIVFFLPLDSMQNERTVLNNLKNSRLPRRRKALILLFSDTGDIFKPISLAMYFLWLEDSIQANILANTSSLAENIRGFQVSELTASSSLGVLVGFVIVWVLISLAFLLSRFRFSLFNRILQ
jgi:hypothetical protein